MASEGMSCVDNTDKGESWKMALILLNMGIITLFWERNKFFFSMGGKEVYLYFTISHKIEIGPDFREFTISFKYGWKSHGQYVVFLSTK